MKAFRQRLLFRLGQEWRLFAMAMQLLTRLRTPHFADFEPQSLNRAARYFPLIGLAVGGVSGGVLLMASTVWSGVLPGLFAIAAGIFVTGAFHEDGWADFFDSLGGATPQARLAIMKDSRLGTYGALALLLGVSGKIGALASLPPVTAALALIAAHAAGRAAAVAAMSALPYAGDSGNAKITPLGSGPGRENVAIALALGVVPLSLLPSAMAFTGGAFGIAFAFVVVWLALRMISGVTGDVLGAIEQGFELGFLLGVSAWASS